MNNVSLYGNIVRISELRTVGNGDRKTDVINFVLATHRHFRRANGGKDKETTFVDCEAWDSGATTIAEYCSKGDPLLIEKGSLRNDNYEKDGVMHYGMKVRVEKFQLMPRKNNNAPVESNELTEQEPVAVENGEDIPF